MLRVARLLSLALLSACQYNLDSLYDHGGDGGLGGDTGSGVNPVSSEQLIGAWIGRHPAVDEECVACAEERCTGIESSCRADPECVAYTECVGGAPHPAGQADCRARFASWVRSGNVRDRDLIGPYGQCVFRDRCQAECEGATDLWCAQAYAWPTTPDSAVPLHLYLTNASDQTTPLASVRVRVCPATDVDCEDPEGEAISDAQGLVVLSLPTSFSRAFTGYLELEGADVYPTLLKFSWPMASATTQVTGIVNGQLFTQALRATGFAPDPARGMLQLRMLGCAGIGVRGVSFSANPAGDRAKTWYIDGLPKFDATETNAVGSGGIIDLPQGNTLVTATRVSDSAPVARVDAPVRAGFMTVVVFAPLAD